MQTHNKQLSQADFDAILHNHITNRNYKVTSHSIEPLSDSVEGIVGEHFIVNITYNAKEPKSQRFFMKTLNGYSKEIFELAMTLKAYEKEEFFYSFLLKEYKKYGIDVSFAPKAYLLKPYYIVLEDLSPRGFRCTPKKITFDLEHCKLALTTLAEFHASSMTYESCRSKGIGVKYSLLDKYSEILENKVILDDDNNAAARWFKYSLEGVFEIISLVSESDVKSNEFKDKLNEIVDSFNEIMTPTPSCRNTVIHGDMWSNNLMFRYVNSRPVECVLVDYQLLKYGLPSVDVMQFIHINTKKQFRDEHYEDLLRFYHVELNRYLKKYDTDALPEEEFLRNCDYVKITVKLESICHRAISCLSDDTFAEALQTDESFTKFLFEDRSKHIIRAFCTNESFRDLIQEDVLELRDMLYNA